MENSAGTIQDQQRVRRNAWLRNWCKRNPEARFGRYQRHRLKSKYGMTVDDFNVLLKAQEETCLICNEKMDVTTADNRKRHGKSATVDHNHTTQEVRALLCNNCNRALGLFGGKIRTLQAAVSYLKIFHED